VFELVGGVAPDAVREQNRRERVQQRRPVGDIDIWVSDMGIARRHVLVRPDAQAQCHQKDEPAARTVTLVSMPSCIVADSTAREFVQTFSSPLLWEKAYQP
jgi:hypothetical protein